MPYRLRTQTLGFILLWISSLLLFREPLSRLVDLSLHNAHYTHIVFVPFLSLGLILLRRDLIFAHARYRSGIGFPMVVLATALAALTSTRAPRLDPEMALSLEVAGVTMVWLAAFVLYFGVGAFVKAAFPLCMVLLIIPIPPVAVGMIESTLQKASAEVTAVIFHLSATPVFRDGLHFSLPGVTIEVARECSGIRATIALVITGLVLSHLVLKSGWTKVLLVVLTVPIAIFKNALRISILSWLGIYVSKDFLFGALHHRGGPLFSLLSIAILVPLLLLLKKSEERSKATAKVLPVVGGTSPSPSAAGG